MAAKAGRFEAAEAAARAVDLRVATVGMWLFLAANAFFFAAWYFAFFYLKAINNNNAWLIQGLTRPNRAYGTIVLVMALISIAAYALASRAAAVRTVGWRLPAVVALVVGLGACVFQGYEMWHLGFGLTQGSYPAVFAGLTASWLLEFVAAMFWLATIISQTRLGGDTVTRPASVVSFANALYFLGVVAVLNWIILYFLP
ncbi:MAG TPA: hypothetical protein VET65_12085 [Candidatus Limnocylindrales bacterium]|nr:hypothetical protein [Candidatus Limnocylindrales bacterium]